MAFLIRHIWRDYAAPAVAFLCVTTILFIVGGKLFIDSQDCDFCPVRLLRLDVEPERVRVGETLTLYDGLCNDLDEPLSVQLYLGAEAIGGLFTGRTIDLLSREIGGERQPATDTPEGRVRRTLQPGCTYTDPIRGPLPPAFTPGKWQLRVHVLVIGPQGQTQSITRTSEIIEVLP